MSRIIFAGTPDFSVPPLRALLDSDHEVVAVYTQPDRPAGRGRKLKPSPVKQLADVMGVPVRQPASLRDADAQAELAALRPDLMVVVAYGLILPQAVLDIPRHGCVNIHASLLPRWRGAAPIQRAIEAGDATTGVCLMRMEAGLDTGPVLARAATDIDPDETGGELHDRLAELGATLLARHLGEILADALPPQAQNDAEANYAHKLSKAEALIDWRDPAETIARRVRAFNPWPVAQTRWQGEPLRIWAAEAETASLAATPGEVLAADEAGIVVACGQGALRLITVQAAGGKPLPAAAFLNGRALPPGSLLGRDPA